MNGGVRTARTRRSLQGCVATLYPLSVKAAQPSP